MLSGGRGEREGRRLESRERVARNCTGRFWVGGKGGERGVFAVVDVGRLGFGFAVVVDRLGSGRGEGLKGVRCSEGGTWGKEAVENV